MPTISLTDNTGLNLSGSSADDNATLTRYLESLLTFKTPPSFAPIANLLVKDQQELDFPIALSATGEGKFAVEKTTLDIQLGAAASLGLLQDSDESDFLSGLGLAGDASSSGLVSFALEGTVSAGDSAAESDFSFGVTDNATVTLTSYYAATPGDTLGKAVEKAVAGLTIPHDLNDLESLPANCICQLDGAGSIKFSASVSYSFLNDPLAAASISNLPSFSINATASATIEATATHTSDHSITIAKLPNGLVHLAVSLTKTDDFETSLTVSAGVGANIGSQDALAFLLDRINPNAAAEADAIASQMKNAAQFKSDIKSAIESALSSSLGASLKAALDNSKARNRAFLYEIDLHELDAKSKPVLQAALTGDFTAITRSGARFSGIKAIDSSLSVTATDTHTLALHCLGIFNAASVNEFVTKSTIDYVADTHEIVLSDETLQVLDSNLDAEKLRKLVLKDITLTLPASANTKDVQTPITIAFLDREGSTSPSKMRRFVNVLEGIGAPGAGAAQSLLAQNLKHYGVCSLFVGVNLDPAQSRQIFIDANGTARKWAFYIGEMCDAEKAILAGDPDSAYRMKLFNADEGAWNSLRNAGAASNMIPILKGLGLPDGLAQLAVTDALTAIWWASAMADYAAALAAGQSLIAVGKEVVKDANLGYSEPWMVLATWTIAGKPAIQSAFASSLPKPALAAH